MIPIVSGGRLRTSPFHQSTVEEGAESFLTYNGMLIPRGYGNREAEYWRLVEGVSMWDVSAQRQVQIEGPDAAHLVQVLCTRDLSAQAVNQGKYVAICDHQGTLINDPIVLKHDEQRYWLSIANSDIWFWARCVAGERRLNVTISEPDASPLAIQGPKATDVVASLFGDWVTDLKYFWFNRTQLDGIPLVVARSGWSKQGGFEIYLLDHRRGNELWNIVREAGQPFDIGPGYPNPSERTESGLLNFGTDTDEYTNPFEVRMRRFVSLDLDDAVIGIKPLRKILVEGVKRHQLGIIVDGPEEDENQSVWQEVEKDGLSIGHMTHKAWSYRLRRMIGYALVSQVAQPGDHVEVVTEVGRINGKLVSLPFDTGSEGAEHFNTIEGSSGRAPATRS